MLIDISMKLKYIVYLVLGMFLGACNDFLDKDPDNRVYLDTPEAVSELLVTAYPQADYSFAETMSDNASDRGVNAILQERWNEQPYFWQDCSDIYQGTPTWYWNESYAAIAAANHALEAIEKFEKEGRSEEVRAARGEALLCRAYAHFMLANIFCMPYNPTTADRELGLPYPTKPETTLNPLYERETLAETYRLIEQDLIEGLDLVASSYAQSSSWHFTRKAAYAFASRFYLWMGGRDNWLKSIDYANLVLGDLSTVNDVSSMLRPMNDSNGDYLGDYYDAQKIYTSSDEKSNLLLVACPSMFYYQPYIRYGLGVGIRYTVYDSGIFGYDWAYRIYGAKDYVYHRPLWSYYFLQSGLNAETGIIYASIPLLTNEEVLFNRAEANALLHKFDDALVDMNSFLKVRLNNWNSSNAISKGDVMSEARLNGALNLKLNPYFKENVFGTANYTDSCYVFVEAILHMRRAEFLGTGMRWFDVRRYDIPIVHTSASTNYADTLVCGDRRRACQIPTQSISSGIAPNITISESDKANAATLRPIE